MEPRTTPAEPAPGTGEEPRELDLGVIGLAVFFVALIAIVAALLLVPSLT